MERKHLHVFVHAEEAGRASSSTLRKGGTFGSGVRCWERSPLPLEDPGKGLGLQARKSHLAASVQGPGPFFSAVMGVSI